MIWLNTKLWYSICLSFLSWKVHSTFWLQTSVLFHFFFILWFHYPQTFIHKLGKNRYLHSLPEKFARIFWSINSFDRFSQIFIMKHTAQFLWVTWQRMQTNPWVTPELLSCLVQLKLSRVIFYHYHLKKKNNQYECHGNSGKRNNNSGISVTGFILPFHFAKLTNQHWFSMVCIIWQTGWFVFYHNIDVKICMLSMIESW